MTFQMLSVDFDEVTRYRHRWLHPDLDGPPVYEGDLDPGAKHIMWISNDKVAGIASLVPDLRKIGPDNIQWRLRAIALSPEKRGAGLGILFTKNIVIFAKKRNLYPFYGTSLVDATGAFVEAGAHIVGEPYELNGVGLHNNFLFC